MSLLNKNYNAYSMYVDDVSKRIIERLDIPKNSNKKVVEMPKFGEYKCLLKYNYTVQQLKEIAKMYKLKLSGTKIELLTRIYSFLYLSNSVLLVQKVIRGYLVRKYNNAHGPAYISRSLCTNSYDFLSMDELTHIPKEQFFSFKDDDGFVYGFDVVSMYNLIFKNNGSFKNPYTNKPVTAKTLEEFRTLLRLSRVLNIKVITKVADFSNELTNEKATELRALALFQTIDLLGNYSKVQWFMSLSKKMLIKFIDALIDIWNYRSEMSTDTKIEICPPHGKPFASLPQIKTLIESQDMTYLRNKILECLEKMVNCGINEESKKLGALYILSALTLVKTEVAVALPWLYESVAL